MSNGGEPIERAVAALRGGRPVELSGSGMAILAVETATAAMLDLLDPHASAPLLLSGARALALGLGNARDAADPAEPVKIARQPWLDRDTVLRLVDPAFDFSRGPAGPLVPEPIEDAAAARAAVELARRAGLLPALWLVDQFHALAASIDPAELNRVGGSATIVARASLPLEGLPATQIAVFRTAGEGDEHAALIVGAPGGRPPLVRLHSECLTGDVFGSLKCDCGPQLHAALALIGAAGGGVLLYLRQEGRGIGLANKIRAYQLQDRGLDTVEANRRLGFADDERDFTHAAAMLRALHIDEVRLLTNNPAKVAGLEACGIRVVERVPHHMPANPHNADYLDTKRRKSGHLD